MPMLDQPMKTLSDTDVEIDDELADKVRVAGHDPEALATFIEAALSEAREMKEEAGASGYKTEIDLSPENVREVEVENREFKDPWVYVWLHDCTVGACETRRFRIGDLNDWNNYVHAVIDIREF